jgi:hypothetical protein
VVFATKIPLPILILLGWAVLRRPRRPTYDELFLLLPAAIFFFLASRSVYQSGLRNIYAILPLLAIYSGRVLCLRFPQAIQVSSPGNRARILAAAICVWLGLIALKVHPHHISYYNALVGGPSGGIWASVGSTDLNWGQGWILLRRTMEQEGIDEIYLGSPGRFRPSVYGVAARRIRFDAFKHPEQLPPGVYAVSTTYVRRFDWLKAKKPFARVGNVLWLYRLDGSAAGGRPADASSVGRE